MTADPVLEVTDVRKRYGRTVALGGPWRSRDTAGRGLGRASAVAGRSGLTDDRRADGFRLATIPPT